MTGQTAYNAVMSRHGMAALLLFTGCACQPKAPAPLEGSAAPQPPPAPPAPRAEAPRPEAPRPEVSPPKALPIAGSSSGSGTPSTAVPPSSEPSRAVARVATAVETQQCRARGGTIQPVCMMGQHFCVVPYRDGGKRCADKSDCLGACLYEGTEPAPPHATGSCQRTNNPCGCRASIHQGRVRPAVCLD